MLFSVRNLKNILLVAIFVSCSIAQVISEAAVQYSKNHLHNFYIHVKANCYNLHTSKIVAHKSGMIGSLAFFLEDKISDKVDINELNKIPYLNLLDVFKVIEENLIPSFSSHYEAYVKYEYSDLLVRELLHKFTKYKIIKKLSPEILLVPVLKKGKVLDFHCDDMIKPWHCQLRYLNTIKTAVASANEREIIQNNIRNDFTVFEKDIVNLLEYQNFHSIIFMINEFFVDEDSNYNLHTRFVTFYKNDRESDLTYTFDSSLNTEPEVTDNIFKAPIEVVNNKFTVQNDHVQYLPLEKVKKILHVQSKLLMSKDRSKKLIKDTYTSNTRQIKFLIEKCFSSSRKNMINKLTQLGKVQLKQNNSEGEVFVVSTNLDDTSIARRLYLSNLTYHVSDLTGCMNLIVLPNRVSRYIN